MGLFSKVEPPSEPSDPRVVLYLNLSTESPPIASDAVREDPHTNGDAADWSPSTSDFDVPETACAAHQQKILEEFQVAEELLARTLEAKAGIERVLEDAEARQKVAKLDLRRVHDGVV